MGGVLAQRGGEGESPMDAAGWLNGLQAKKREGGARFEFEYLASRRTRERGEGE